MNLKRLDVQPWGPLNVGQMDSQVHYVCVCVIFGCV